MTILPRFRFLIIAMFWPVLLTGQSQVPRLDHADSLLLATAVAQFAWTLDTTSLGQARGLCLSDPLDPEPSPSNHPRDTPIPILSAQACAFVPSLGAYTPELHAYAWPTAYSRANDSTAIVHMAILRAWPSYYTTYERVSVSPDPRLNVVLLTFVYRKRTWTLQSTDQEALF